MKELVITAVGPDRPGLVDHLTGFFHEAGANVADSRMVNLRGQFALIVLVEAEDTAASAIAQQLVTYGQTIGLTITIAPQAAAGSRTLGVPFTLRVLAMDQPGIVHRITHLLHQRQVNIEELETRLEAGSVSGTPLFNMELRVTVPAGVPVKALRAELEALCDGLNCDLLMRSGAGQ